MKNTITLISKSIGIILLVTILIGFFFISCSPQFGGRATKEQKKEYKKSENFTEGRFVNEELTRTSPNFKEVITLLLEYTKSNPKAAPENPIPVEKIDSLDIVHYKNKNTRLIWFGHSTFLIQMNNKNILIDPMFGEVPAPYPWLTSKRFSTDLPIEVEKLPIIDIVILSHDHYDHLDYGSILKLKNKVKKFYTPLGVGAHLQKWGIEKERIIELDWWQESKIDDLIIKCTPARHFSGRGLLDTRKTLWSSWVIQSKTENIFFSGDSGYGEHFKKIGEKYGPFDIALMECGQYNEKFPDIPIHMLPEQTAQASLDVKAKKVMPIHWGAFKLAQHPWKEPVERLIAKAKELNIELVTPKIGESYVLKKSINSNSTWWRY